MTGLIRWPPVGLISHFFIRWSVVVCFTWPADCREIKYRLYWPFIVMPIKPPCQSLKDVEAMLSLRFQVQKRHNVEPSNCDPASLFATTINLSLSPPHHHLHKSLAQRRQQSFSHLTPPAKNYYQKAGMSLMAL